MKVVRTIEEARTEIGRARSEGREIRFVPTMGFLHEGHLSLVDLDRGEESFTVVSIFVNPTQFGPGEDFEVYPRDEKRDLGLLEERSVDLVFVPGVEEMYPEGFATTVSVEGVTAPLEGAHRPGHFDGVSTVVARLFNIVQPDVAIFGQKDAQQVAVVRKMITDLAFPVRLEIGTVVRESDGLAMSSRNVRLKPEQRKKAAGLHDALRHGADLWSMGTEIETVEREMVSRAESSGLEVEYLRLVGEGDFLQPSDASEADLIVGAARVGGVRLIDNVRLDGGR